MDPDALKSDLIIMKSILQKNTGLNENNKKKEIKQNSVEKGYFIIGSGGRGEGGGDESGASSDDGDGVDERLKGGKKEEGVVKVEKEGVRQCLSSKCLVEQLPNTLSVSFKGLPLVVTSYLNLSLSVFIYLSIYLFHFYFSLLCYQFLVIYHGLLPFSVFYLRPDRLFSHELFIYFLISLNTLATSFIFLSPSFHYTNFY